MHLNYLVFDYSEDAEGHGSFDAMASALPAQAVALQTEVQQVLAWAHQQFPNAQGPLEDGGEWDHELQGTQEVATSLAVTYDAAASRLQWQPGTPGAPRLTLSITLSGTPAFCAAFRDAFGVD